MRFGWHFGVLLGFALALGMLLGIRMKVYALSGDLIVGGIIVTSENAQA